MEEWLVNLIANVPLAVAMLVIYYFITKDQTRLEESREETRKADEAARNNQIDSLIAIQGGTQVALSNVGEILAGLHTDLGQHDGRMRAMRDQLNTRLDELETVAVTTRIQSADTLEIVRPLPGMTKGTHASVQALETRLGQIEEQIAGVNSAVQLLCERCRDSEQTAAVQSAISRMMAAVDGLREDLDTVRKEVHELLARTAGAAMDP